MQVKICGIRDAAAARACADAGADYAGLNFVAGSRRAVDLERARGLLPLLGEVEPVAVLRDPPVDHALALAAALGLRWVQLHGSEGPDVCERLAVGGNLNVIKAITADQVGDRGRMAAYAGCVTALLVDGREPGSGRPWAWSDLAPLLGEARGRIAGVRWWLAGGLDPANVAAGIEALQPAAVDAASGVERQGHTDPARIATFCRAARRARHGGAA